MALELEDEDNFVWENEGELFGSANETEAHGCSAPRPPVSIRLLFFQDCTPVHSRPLDSF